MTIKCRDFKLTQNDANAEPQKWRQIFAKVRPNSSHVAEPNRAERSAEFFGRSSPNFGPSLLGRVKYFFRVWHFLRQGACKGRSTPTVHLGPSLISETIRARKLKFYKHLGRVKYSFRVWIFFRQGACKGRSTPYCTFGTAGCCTPCTPPSGKIFIPKTSIWPASLYVKFQLSSSDSFGDMMGSQIYIRGAAPLTRPLAEKFSHPKRIDTT